MEDYGVVVKDLLRLPLVLRPGDRLLPKVLEDAFVSVEGVDRSPRSTLTGFASEGSDGGGAFQSKDWAPGPVSAEGCAPGPMSAEGMAPRPRRVEARFHFVGVYDGHGGSEVARQVAENLHLHLRKAFGIVMVASLTQAADGHAPWASHPIHAPIALEVTSRDADVTRQSNDAKRLDIDVTRQSNDATRRDRDSELPPHSRCPLRRRDLTDALSHHKGITLAQMRDAVELAFCLMDGQLRGTEAARLEGTTAIIALVSESTLCVANVGDSRAVLSRKGVACGLTRDHKPYLEDEEERIVACGGEVLNCNGRRVMGVLAMSRAFGDHCLSDFGVISEPEVTLVETNPDDDFLILASDGLWDAISDAEAVKLTHRCFERAATGVDSAKLTHGGARQLGAEIASRVLIKAATDRGSRDNITVTVVDLRGNCEL